MAIATRGAERTFGCKLVFGTSGLNLAAYFKDITIPFEREPMDTTHHGSPIDATTKQGYPENIPGGVLETTVLTVQVFTNLDDFAGAAQPTLLPPETITFTAPIPTGQSNGATIVGTGHVSRWAGDWAVKGVQGGEWVITFSGAVVITAST